jgi:hypothetical protein
MSTSLEHVVYVLRRTGLKEVADEAQQTLSDPPDEEELERFAAEHGLSQEALMERMGGSP